jgi:hypothetical protein
MIIKNNLRPTTIRTNSRFRGPTELEKYSNFVLETVHDLKLLSSVMDRNDYIEGHRGHTDYINDNFVAYVGGGVPITSNIATASTLQVTKEDVFDSLNLMDANWVAHNGCSKTQTETGVQLSTSGLLDPAGIKTQKYVEEGDIIYIRMGVRFISGDNESFTIGSSNINQGDGDLEKFKLPQNGSTIYIDKRLYCKHREPIEININVHNVPDILTATNVEVFDVEIKYMSENNLAVAPINTQVKSKVNELEDKVKNIINNI